MKGRTESIAFHPASLNRFYNSNNKIAPYTEARRKGMEGREVTARMRARARRKRREKDLRLSCFDKRAIFQRARL